MPDPKHTLDRLVSSYVTFSTVGNAPLAKPKATPEDKENEQHGKTAASGGTEPAQDKRQG